MPSTVISSFSYDEQRSTLEIEFISGSKYVYYDVPKEVYKDFRQFREKGVFYNRSIKNQFRYEKLKAAR